jgi:hypothetical protein
MLKAFWFTMQRMHDAEGTLVPRHARERNGPLMLQRHEVEAALRQYLGKCGGAEYVDPDLFEAELTVPGKPVAHLTRLRIKEVADEFIKMTLKHEPRAPIASFAVATATDAARVNETAALSAAAALATTAAGGGGDVSCPVEVINDT